MNWDRIVRLTLPTSLRLGRGMRCVLMGVLCRAIGDAEDAERWKCGLLEDMRYIGQREPLEELLRAKFGAGVTIGRYEPSNVAYFSAEAGAQEVDDGRYPGTGSGVAVYMTPMAYVDLGYDFCVNIPRGTDVAAVADVVRRYVFEGVNFKIIEI